MDGIQDWLNVYPTNKVILSPFDLLSLDGGFGNILGGPSLKGNFSTWLDMYNMNLDFTPAAEGQVLGAEVLLSSELVNYNIIDGKYWIRASSMAERLWNKDLIKDEKLSSRVRRLIAH